MLAVLVYQEHYFGNFAIHSHFPSHINFYYHTLPFSLCACFLLLQQTQLTQSQLAWTSCGKLSRTEFHQETRKGYVEVRSVEIMYGKLNTIVAIQPHYDKKGTTTVFQMSDLLPSKV